MAGLGAVRDSLAETFDCSFGMSCSNDLDKAVKAKFGGSSSGTPDGRVLRFSIDGKKFIGFREP